MVKQWFQSYGRVNLPEIVYLWSVIPQGVPVGREARGHSGFEGQQVKSKRSGLFLDHEAAVLETHSGLARGKLRKAGVTIITVNIYEVPYITYDFILIKSLGDGSHHLHFTTRKPRFREVV